MAREAIAAESMPNAAAANATCAVKRGVLIAALAGALACIVFALPFLSRTVATGNLPALWTKELLKLKNLGVATQHYQAEHGSSAWPTLEQLFEFGGDDVTTQFGVFIEPGTGKSRPWLYMPEGKPRAGERIVLIAAPIPRPADAHSKGKERRAVLWSDFKAEFFDEAEFQQRLKDAKQKKRNGNIKALLKASDGTIVAAYEYGPFGEPLRATGAVAKTNPFRFSTKYCDEETGLCYYGYRYHDTSKGRWLNRDPITETGGINLYTFCSNRAIQHIDLLGRELLLNTDDAPLKAAAYAMWWTIKSKASEEIKAMMSEIESSTKVCRINLMASSKAVFIGNYFTKNGAQDIDFGDISALNKGGPLGEWIAEGFFLHEIVERWARVTSGMSKYDAHHKEATRWENKYTGLDRREIDETNVHFNQDGSRRGHAFFYGDIRVTGSGSPGGISKWLSYKVKIYFRGGEVSGFTYEETSNK